MDPRHTGHPMTRPLLLDLFCGAGGNAANGTELSQAIPPAYTEYIGGLLLDAIRTVA